MIKFINKATSEQKKSGIKRFKPAHKNDPKEASARRCRFCKQWLGEKRKQLGDQKAVMVDLYQAGLVLGWDVFPNHKANCHI